MLPAATTSSEHGRPSVDPGPRGRVEEESVPAKHVHRPVLLTEVVEQLAPRPGAVFVDGTLGLGGHASDLLAAIQPGGRLYGIDRDPRALALASERLSEYGEAFVPLRGDHADLEALLAGHGVFAVDGILLDLGVSSMQLDDPERGFSFRKDGPLDMRMDPDGPTTAADLLASESEDELRRILKTYGEERAARAIARAIVRLRKKSPLTRTTELARLVEKVLGPAARRFRIHPATRTFQALRVAVNQEVVALEQLVGDAVSLLRRSGRLAVIAYHSLEDRAIKHTYRTLAARCTCPPRLPRCACGKENLIRVVTRKPVRPGTDEIERNTRARSARLRVAERL